LNNDFFKVGRILQNLVFEKAKTNVFNMQVGFISPRNQLFGGNCMKYFKAIFWLFSAIIILQAVAPINGPNSKLNQVYIFFIRLDYLIHTGMIMCLSVLFRIAYFPKPRMILRKELIFFGVILFAAILSEAVQLLVPYRTFNINDLTANLLGVICSIPLIRLQGVFHKQKL
jgi:VanZ family protein